MAIEQSGNGPSAGDETAAANTDVTIWRSGAAPLTRADIDALIEAAVFLRTYAANKGPIPLDATIEKLQIIRSGDYYADSIHVTEHGGIGIDCGGTVFVKPVRAWHALAVQAKLAEVGYFKADVDKLQREIAASLPEATFERWRDYGFTLEVSMGMHHVIAAQPRREGMQDQIFMKADEVVALLERMKARPRSKMEIDQDSGGLFIGLFICSIPGGTHAGACPTCGCVVQAPYNEESVANMGFDWAALQRLRKAGEAVRVCPYCLDQFKAETYAHHRCSKRPPEAPR